MHRRLIVRPGAIGDFILSLPAMERLRTDYLEVWANTQNLSLARFADRARSIASTGLDMLEIDPPVHLIQELRKFDSIVSWYGSARPEFRDTVRSLGLPFQFFTAIPPENCGMHAADFYLRQVCPQAQELAIPRIECGVPKPDEAAGFAVIHPFSGSPKKCWPLERYWALAQKLEATMPVRWCAGPEDTLPHAIHIDDLYELACWLAGARVYIGNDSGITHLAAAAGTQVVALFGPTDPDVWAPRGPNVRVIARPALDQIQVDNVARAVLGITRG
jgi:heptosyltransferase-3